MPTQANPPGVGRDRGFKFLGIAVAVFVGCSIIQALGGSHMFTNAYTEPDSFFLGLLMQLTWWPGWLATAYFALFGAAMIYTDRKLV